MERGADDRLLLMGCAVPRMQRPGPPDARRMPLSEDGTGAWIPPASGRNPRPLMRRMCYNSAGGDIVRIDLDAAQIEMILEGLILSAQAHERAGDTAQAEDARDLADELERMLAHIRDSRPLIY